MSSQIETIIEAYKKLSKIPSLSSGQLNNDGSKISSKWSVRNLDRGKSTSCVHDYILDSDLNVTAQSEFAVDVSNEKLSAVSPKGTFKAVIYEEKESKDSKKQYLQVWCRHYLTHSINLTELDIHGDVYADSEFGCLNWSPDESSLVYVAEKKLEKLQSYVKRQCEDKSKENGSGEFAPKRGEEYIYREDWGEQMAGKHQSVVVVCKPSTESFTILKGLPKGFCPGQVCFDSNGESVIGVAWETKPRRLGLIYCTNRPSFIFQLTLNGTMSMLTSKDLSVRSPRMRPDGGLVWLQRAAEGPHHACHALVTRNNDAQVSTVIDIVRTGLEIANGGIFHGIYCHALPARCFASEGRIVFSTSQRNEVRAYIADIDGGRIVDISNKSMTGSTSVLDVSSDVVLARCSNLKIPDQLYVARLPAKGSESDIQWIAVSKPCDVPESLANSTVQYMELEHDNTDAVRRFTALYFAPDTNGRKLPLVVWPHGGPHSNFINSYSIEAALFNILGLASLQINYRGSTGTGDTSVRFLPKRIGDADVKDCKLATDEALKLYPVDPSKLCLFGGSHGGFLVTHLSGQYPDLYSVVVTRNPVIDLPSMFASTDIADWINFRGSTGQGDDTVRCLISHVGDYDVSDCFLTVKTLKEKDTRLEGLALYGGSYGGLVTAHLAGSYPDMFEVVAMRNPLIDMATKGYYADNSDGCAVEAGFAYSEKRAILEEEVLAMFRCSPINYVTSVKAPTAVMLGSGDKRVPHHQGLTYSRRLQANGVPTRVYMYDDNHSLSSLPVEVDNLINSADWLLTHLNSKTE